MAFFDRRDRNPDGSGVGVEGDPIFAMAETGWTDRKAKSGKRFKAVAGQIPVLYGRT
jgi:hypothetical protein